jgi:Tfp pilus assembly protein PilN
MPQQVNLCLPILRKQKSRFAAQSLAQALAVLLALGGALSAVWVWSLNGASDSLRITLASQTRELEGLRVAMEQSKLSSGPAQEAMAQEIKLRKAELQQREKVLSALNQGLFQPDHGHAARLQLVAQTIPAVAWVTQIRADDRLLEVSGYTLEPSALNDWVGKLAASTLLKGQALSTVKVESVRPESLQTPAAATVPQAATKPEGAAAMAQAASVRPAVWSFSLLSNMVPTPRVAAGQP